VRRVWDEILDMVGRRSKRVAALLREATVRDVQGDVLVLVFKTGTLAEMFSASPELLLDAMHEVLGGVWQVRCEVGGDQRSAGGGGYPRAANPSRAGGARGSGTGPRGGSGDAGTPNGRTSAGAVAPAPADSDWPEPALPGGAQRSQPTTEPGPTGQATIAAGSGSGADSGTMARSRAKAGSGSGTARSAPGGRRGKDAAGPVSNDRTAGRNSPAGQDRPIGQDRADTDGWAGEPPYDPDYDGPARTAAAYTSTPAYEGFDPGDEPLDEVVDEQTVRQTSEQQALQLIQQALGAEKIGEI
jgi:DNA polymerase-3 subunit gamma/tau